MEQDGFRLGSVRAARRGIEMALEAHRLGRLSSAGLTARVGAYKAWTEIFLVEQELMKLNLDFEAPEHPLGIDGGLVLQPVSEAVIRKVVTKSGVSARGTTIDETSEVVQFLDAAGEPEMLSDL